MLHVARALLPLDLLTPPVACPRGAHAGERGREGKRTSCHQPQCSGAWQRVLLQPPALLGLLAPQAGGGVTSLMPPAPPVLPRAQCDRLDTETYTAMRALSKPPMPLQLLVSEMLCKRRSRRNATKIIFGGSRAACKLISSTHTHTHTHTRHTLPRAHTDTQRHFAERRETARAK